ncbi:MAG: hypothetical protein WAO52_09215 [Prolixibacteraceae bacterium]
MPARLLKIVIILLIIILSIIGIYKLILIKQRNACIKSGGFWNEELNRCEPAEENIRDYYWYTEADSVLNREYLVRGEKLAHISGSPEQLIQALNRREPKCKIELISLKNDTIHVRFTNEECLSEQMGSTGAFCFLGETVFTLTENDSIKFVDIRIEFGSHASPGIYQRSDFQELEKKEMNNSSN